MLKTSLIAHVCSTASPRYYRRYKAQSILHCWFAHRRRLALPQHQRFTVPHVHQVCLHLHAPHDSHWTLVKRILRHIRGTLHHELHLHASPSTDLRAYSYADWAGCPDTRHSTSGYCVYLEESLVSWSTKRQTTVSRSSAEAEYRAMANATAECCWLRQLLRELHVDVPRATIIYCDNVSAVYLTKNPVHHLSSLISISSVRRLHSVNFEFSMYLPSCSTPTL